ncbi:bifunctional adenosylcobinamide kinase/adenosylcobinamide-phosphate guanylyltransferase [Tropicimonas marinistellae]|uniref:bifunctional adenosylcobinamide kinase/adenosylcobinamide-phosphate guanylyltransferase n=1 Tax=Tropicimonas marinistellae TaxID=1739787 RepID=UPI00082D9587|nr:bifunctional adenosylcobinamide kinase/adenosylcobinamide-phosphate guanylyltransferase [Tropicimonas marinistellae]
MTRVILITGGARSGKSRHAECRARALPGGRVYIATAEAHDDEMRGRIAKHRAQRAGDGWTTVEAPLDLVAVLARTDGEGVRLVDCLTLWLSNLLLAERDWEPEAARLVEALRRQSDPVVLVSNEVGMGIVPENALARSFRDAQGWLNQRVADVADEVEFVVAGLPLRVK